MIEKDSMTGIYLVCCDAKCCRNSKEYDTFENWPDLLRSIHKDGWTSHKIGNIWKNLCNECSKLVKKKRKRKSK